jgi:hypothetical protein
MKVQFQNSFFGPDHTLYRKDTVYDVPAEWKDTLPKGAQILEEAKKSSVKQANRKEADPEENPKQVAKNSAEEVQKILEGKTK